MAKAKKTKEKAKLKFDEHEEAMALALGDALSGKFNDEHFIMASVKLFDNALLKDAVSQMIENGRAYFIKNEKKAGSLTEKDQFATPIGVTRLNVSWEECGDKIVETLLDENSNSPHAVISFTHQHYYLLGMFELLNKMRKMEIVTTSGKDGKQLKEHKALIRNTVAFVKVVLLAFVGRVSDEAQDTSGQQRTKSRNTKRSHGKSSKH